MPANGSKVVLKKGGKPVVIEITIGQAQWGRYKITLWDSDGHKFEPVGEGLNYDQVPDFFEINKSIASLKDRLLSWDVAIAPLGNGKSELYSLVVRISQGGQVVPGGSIVDTGQLDGGIFLSDFVTIDIAQ